MEAILLRRKYLGKTSCNSIAEKSTTGISAVLNTKLPSDFSPDLVFRWGCTSNIPSKNVVNTSKAIHNVNDKRAFRMLLNDKGLCPKTWFHAEKFLVETPTNMPAIIRPATHSQGKNLVLADSNHALIAAAKKYGNYYISEIIDKVAEYRVFVVQGRVACVASKTPADSSAIAWNVAQGGKFDNVKWGSWPLKAVRVSVEAFELSGLDFGGVDVMVDKDNNAYVIEINSAPSLTSEYRQSCMAKCFDWIVQHGKSTIPRTQDKGGWRKFIHPAISSEALLVA